MPLIFVVSKGTIPIAQVVTPETVVSRASAVGHPNAGSALGITIPRITIDPRAVQYKQRMQGGIPEFSFDTGTLRVELQQEVLLSSDLTVCEQRKWGAHERGHVDDNQDLMDNLEAEVRQYGFFKDVFENGVWYPRTDFQVVQDTINDEIGSAFRTLTEDAATHHDTLAEYRRVAREILRDCPAPINYIIQRGETLSHIALHYYGDASKWNLIYDANRAVIGSSPNMIRVGLKIQIPKP
ncbi:MAG: LysM peptidoglycan-binding domain-containing protein [Planctomyces sp.]|nr:LysM peptidoglycan-binding domain-containing protein [Planctomyces sp.]